MSIGTRLLAIKEHISNAYNSIKNLGVDLTNTNKNINNIKNTLDMVYESYPKITGVGSDIVLNNTKSAKMSVDVEGNSTQIQYEGYNKLPNEATTQTKNGIAVIVNEDKSITLKGTATATTTFLLIDSLKLSAKTYYASGVTGGSENTFYFGILEGSNWIFRNYNGITSFTVNEETTFTQTWIVVANGVTIDTTIFPMISEINTSEYEPYVRTDKLHQIQHTNKI